MKRGKLIALEGIHKAGKKTHGNNLQERLHHEGHLCELVSFPVYDSPSGEVLKMYLGRDNYEPLLGHPKHVNPYIASILFANNRLENKRLVEDPLNAGITVIVDRYVSANLAHQGAKFNQMEVKVPLFNWIDNLEYNINGLPRPDKVILLNLPWKLSSDLIGEIIDESNGDDKSVDYMALDNYHLECSEETHKILADMYEWDKIDCMDGRKRRPIVEIHEEIYRLVKPFFVPKSKISLSA